ncbi:flavodoxin family protein [Methanoregula sp.]|uniref:flavodoxin family protein n=1 Tax=Methanoregula sp. TaxID=2052170 RepID=UPI003C1E2610
MTLLVVYYSRTGHTQTVATSLAKKLNAEVLRIEPAHRVNLAFGAMEALMSMTSHIKPCKTDLSGIDTLVIVSPVWATKVPPYINMYLSLLTGIDGKKFHVLVERGSPGSDRPIEAVRHQLEKKGMKFISSATTVEHEVESGLYEDTVRRFADGILSK